MTTTFHTTKYPPHNIHIVSQEIVLYHDIHSHWNSSWRSKLHICIQNLIVRILFTRVYRWMAHNCPSGLVKPCPVRYERQIKWVFTIRTRNLTRYDSLPKWRFNRHFYVFKTIMLILNNASVYMTFLYNIHMNTKCRSGQKCECLIILYYSHVSACYIYTNRLFILVLSVIW